MALLCFVLLLPAQDKAADVKAADEWVKNLQWRPIGPASMGGRIVDVEVVENNPFTFYIATASGGLFKTTNNGTTFTPVFENEKTVSIGDVAISKITTGRGWGRR